MAESTTDTLGKILPIAVMGGIVGGVSAKLLKRERKDAPPADKVVTMVIPFQKEDKVTELAKKYNGINSDITRVSKHKLRLEYEFHRAKDANAFRKAFQKSE